MQKFRTGFATISTVFLAACAATPEYVPVLPDVPAELRRPVEVRPRPVSGLRDVGLVLADHVEALDAANGRIVAIDCILTAAESGGAAEDCAD